jgi:crotonobetainyl-CoA:carnitine CoA-transferase CaiB-like acyl-CoA transferase
MLANALSGLKVLDFTQIVAGPTCTLLLADLGAEVVKVEAPGGDLARALSPWVQGESVPFLSMNRNKRGVVLDLKRADHAGVARDLAAQSDVVVESFRPGVMTRLGLDHATLSEANPRLIYCSVSAYGQQGTTSQQPGVDGVLQAVSGLMSITGAPGGGPCKVPVPVIDVVTGQMAAIAVLGALAERSRSGRGQHLDVSMFSSAIALQHASFAGFFAGDEVPAPQGSAAPYATPNEALQCADGWIMVAAYHPARWVAFCDILGVPELATDARFIDNKSRLAHRAELLCLLENRMRLHARSHWLEKLTAADIICGPILDYREVSESAPFVEAELAETILHPVAGPTTMPRSTLRAAGERPQTRRAPPTLGQHTAEILAELGYTTQDIEAMRSDPAPVR